MSVGKSIALTVFGQSVTGVSFAVGESVTFTFACQDAGTREALDLTDLTLKASMTNFDLRGNPALPPLFENPCEIVEALAGLAIWTVASTDTATTPLTPGFYTIGLTAFDGAGGVIQLANILLTLTPNPTLT